MRAARIHEFDPELTGPEFLRVEDVPEPSLTRDDEVIVRVGGVGVCRTDLHIIEGLWREALVEEPPYTLGHENAGWVEDVGAAVRGFRPGDPVVVNPAASDGTCRACRRGEDNLCASLVWLGIQKDGGFADYMVARERSLVHLPEGMEPPTAAPLADAGLTSYHAAKRAAAVLEPDDLAVVIGVGGLGHIGLQALRLLTPARIAAVDVSRQALELADELGADATVTSSERVVEEIQDLSNGAGAQAVVDFVAEGPVPEQAFAMTGRGGYWFIVGYGGSLHLPTMAMIGTERRIVGNIGGTHRELEELVDLVSRERLRVITREYPLRDVNQALSDLDGGRITGRGVLVP